MKNSWIEISVFRFRGLCVDSKNFPKPETVALKMSLLIVQTHFMQFQFIIIIYYIPVHIQQTLIKYMYKRFQKFKNQIEVTMKLTMKTPTLFWRPCRRRVYIGWLPGTEWSVTETIRGFWDKLLLVGEQLFSLKCFSIKLNKRCMYFPK